MSKIQPITDMPDMGESCISHKVLHEIILAEKYDPFSKIAVTDNLSMLEYMPDDIEIVLFCNLPEGHTWGNIWVDQHVSNTKKQLYLKKYNCVVIQGCEQPLNNYHGFCAVGIDFGDFETFKVLDRSPLLYSKLSTYNLNPRHDFLVLAGKKEEREQFITQLNARFNLSNSLIFHNLNLDIDTPDYKLYEEYGDFEFSSYQWFDHEGMCLLNRDILPHKKMFDDCSVNIVIETNQKIQTPYPYLSEKTYKPIIHETPFTIFGEPNSLEYLRKKGFATFDSIIDESYDNILDYNERLSAVIESSIELLEKKKTKTSEIEEICKHNKQHFLNKERQQKILLDFKHKIDNLTFTSVSNLYNQI